jgi:hypothetical protein
MRRNLEAYRTFQVFLNHPYDEAFQSMAEAMSFAVIAGGMLPISALDLTAPDRPRIDVLVDAIQCCSYSAHDFSRATDEGPQNWARMNMPIEMGMALFHALNTQRRDHRCLFFVATPHDYRAFASDLAGMDPRVHNNNSDRVLIDTYEWLRNVVSANLFNVQATVAVVEKFAEFKARCATIRGSAESGRASHDESRELMYQVCAECGWWDWRGNRMGKEEFPAVPLAYKHA